jgi:hypothetical protein
MSEAERALKEAIARELLGGAADDYDIAGKLTAAIRDLIDERLRSTLPTPAEPR